MRASLRLNYRSRNPFFARRTPDECDREYYNLMEQQFQLKHYGKLSLFEQNQMISEDRNWYIKRIEEEFKKQQEKERGSSPSMPSKPSMSKPSMPSMPSMSKSRR